MSALNEAIEMATRAHDGQADKAGKPYILHPLRVMLKVEPEGQDAMIAAVLHDVVEDTGITLASIKKQFGPEVANAVESVTRRKGEPYADYILRVRSHPVGRNIKIADLQDNLRPERRVKGTEKLVPRYVAALKVLLGRRNYL